MTASRWALRRRGVGRRWRGGPPGGHERFPALDGYRAVAALAVVATHVGFQTGAGVSGSLAPVLSRLDIGVALFFLLSGFLLYRPHAVAALTGSAPPGTRRYLVRRAVRILPAYWLAVPAALLLVRGNEAARQEPSEWLVQLLLLQPYLPGQPGSAGHLRPGLTQMWSLSVEVAFYLCLPWLAALATRRHRGSPVRSASAQLWVLGGLAAVSLAWQLTVRALPGSAATNAGLWLPAYLDWFAAGMAFAVVSATVQCLGPVAVPRAARIAQSAAAAPWACWGVAGGLFLVATTPLAGPRTLDPATPGEALVKHLLYAAVAAFLLLPGFLGTCAHGPARLLAGRLSSRLGTISYGIFLFHLVVLDLVLRALGLPFFAGGFWPVLGWTVALTVLVAAASWFGLERPLLRRRDRPGGGQRGGASRRSDATTATARATATAHRA